MQYINSCMNLKNIVYHKYLLILLGWVFRIHRIRWLIIWLKISCRMNLSILRLCIGYWLLFSRGICLRRWWVDKLVGLIRLSIVVSLKLLGILCVGLFTRFCLYRFVNAVNLILFIKILRKEISTVFKTPIQSTMSPELILMNWNIIPILKYLILKMVFVVLVCFNKRLEYPVSIYWRLFLRLIRILLIGLINIG